jgi:hypothetical protein
MNRSAVFHVFLVLLGIFLISVVIRYPNINRPLSKHHEFITAIPLRVLQIWEKEGAFRYHFNPVMNYPGKANKYINNHASTKNNMIDAKGNYYYVSHPPFAYILPYMFFKLFHLKATVLNLQIFNLIIHFLTAVFVYLIVCLLSFQKPFKAVFMPGIIAFIVYIFSPGVLWFQMNTYMSDTLVHFPFVIAVYIILKLLMRKRFYSTKYLFFYAVVLFLMIYTSWLGLFFAAAVIFYALIKLRHESVFLSLIFVTSMVTFFAMFIIIKQYSSINGLEAYVIQMLDRFSVRNSVNFSNFFILKSYEIKTLLYNYILSYLPIFILLSVFVIMYFKKAKMGIVFTKNGYRFLWLSVLPVLLLHFFLLNYSGHDFVMLYGSLALSVIVGILYEKLNRANVLSVKVLHLGIAAVVLSSIFIYYYINRPGEYSWKGDLYAQSKNIGTYIHNNAKDNEVVYFKAEQIELDPQIIVYAQRNVIRYTNQNIDSLGIYQNIVLFEVNSGKNISTKRFY